MDRHVAMAVAGQIQMRIGEIDFSSFVNVDGDIRIFPNGRDPADVIKVPVGEKDLLDDPPIFAAQTHQLMPLSSGINQEPVLRFIIDPEITVDLEIALHGHTSDHAL